MAAKFFYRTSATAAVRGRAGRSFDRPQDFFCDRAAAFPRRIGVTLMAQKSLGASTLISKGNQ
jgi:hypothetical protein